MRTQGLSLRSAAGHFNIAAPSTILVWRRLYNEGGITALQSKPQGRPPMSKRSEIQALLPSSQSWNSGVSLTAYMVLL